MGMSIEKSKDILEDVVAYMASYGSAFPSEVYANQSYSEICNAIRTLEKLADKADYEARLKADMKVMLEELNSEIRKLHVRQEDQLDAGLNIGVIRCSNLVQQKIDALKESEDGTDKKTSDK